MSDAGLAEGRALLERAERVAVLTGAGVSAESGVPTFRGPEGLWKSHRPEELATPGAFRRDPRLVWEWYAWRRSLVSECRPNAAHRAIARLLAERPASYLLTQNVDGLHRLAQKGAGTARGDRILELHGSLFRARCTACPRRREHRERVDASSSATLPRCEGCGSLLRPDVVWFGESLEAGLVERAFEVARTAEVCLVVGTSAVVHPAASLPVAAREAGAAVVEVNLDPTPLTSLADTSLRGPAGEILPRLLNSD